MIDIFLMNYEFKDDSAKQFVFNTNKKIAA